MPRERVRFAFVIEDGPNAGLSCPGWRVWVNGEDTYITSKSLDGTWKTSLHGDESWQLAVTTEHLRSAAKPVWTQPDRAPWKFTPTEFIDGKRLAFVIAVARGALLPERVDPKEYVIPVNDVWNELTSAWIWMTEPGVELDETGVIAGPLALASGRSVWLTQNREHLRGDAFPEKQAVGSMVEPMWPEKHDVRAPGVMLRGVHIG